MRNPNCSCKTCGKPIYNRKGTGFCSQACYGMSCRSERSCPVCGTWVPGDKKRITCSRACSNKHRVGNGYKLSGRPIKDKSLKIRALKDRLISSRGPRCEKCNFDVVEILHAHHVIPRSRGGKDEESNLSLLCPNCHAIEHLNLEGSACGGKRS